MTLLSIVFLQHGMLPDRSSVCNLVVMVVVVMVVKVVVMVVKVVVMVVKVVAMMVKVVMMVVEELNSKSSDLKVEGESKE